MKDSINAPAASSSRRPPDKATYDVSNWPVLLTTISSTPMTTQEFQRHLDRMGSFFERGRLGLVVDVRSGSVLSASERKMLATWFDEMVVQHPGRFACFAVVLSSQIQRGIFKAISWLASSPFEREAFAELEPATRWAYACARMSPQAIQNAR
jgi:hypothetical protein